MSLPLPAPFPLTYHARQHALPSQVSVELGPIPTSKRPVRFDREPPPTTSGVSTCSKKSSLSNTSCLPLFVESHTILKAAAGPKARVLSVFVIYAAPVCFLSRPCLLSIQNQTAQAPKRPVIWLANRPRAKSSPSRN